jgi:nucleoside-diphosphate-sugar epimerase
VKLISRSGAVQEALPDGVELVAGDLKDPLQVRQLCEGSESVYFCAMPSYTRWALEFSNLIFGVIRGLAHLGSRLIYGDNLYMYGSTRGTSIAENLPGLTVSNKGRVRKHVADLLLDAQKAEILGLKILRGSDFFGPRVRNSCFGQPVFQAIIDGKPVYLFGNPDLPHSITYIKDFARAMILLAETPAAEPSIFHVPNAPLCSSRKFVNDVSMALSKKAEIRKVSRKKAAFLGLFISAVREVREIMYQWDEPFIVDTTLFSSHFDFMPTPWNTSVSETADWYQKQGELTNAH